MAAALGRGPRGVEHGLLRVHLVEVGCAALVHDRGAERRDHLLRLQLAPVDGPKELMALDLRRTRRAAAEAPGWVLVQELTGRRGGDDVSREGREGKKGKMRRKRG